MTAPTFETLSEAAAWYDAWLREAALPLWGGVGVDARNGAFVEALTLDGKPVAAPRRARVQARQAYVFATMAASGYGAQHLAIAQRGFQFYVAHYQRPDGLFVMSAAEDGTVIDPAVYLYEQDFSLLALAGLKAAAREEAAPQAAAEHVLQGLRTLRHAHGGFRETGEHPFQSNAHMHLLEAALAWDELKAGPIWTALADEIVALCLARFIDAERGFLREFFDADWRPAPGEAGRCVEPGHQFEWAWLLERWGRARGEPEAREAARTLFAHGLRGVDRQRGVAMNALNDDGSVRDATARLWPQTEYLKAAIFLGHEAEALSAARALTRYLDAPAAGAWRDKWRADGTFVGEPAPATSLYHLIGAVLALQAVR